MGLDVGVVKVKYLERPSRVISDFLWSLAENLDESGWGGGWEGNAFIETTQLSVLTQAAIYAAEHNLTSEETKTLELWIGQLPWDGDSIMLHINW